ncbi:phospholipase A2-like, partial [Copidosoma floridanum]|uniref:phospholipase A2-like n=1 Tax=Copidosoma floridanum TaxID=29053 RepID=UPI0006C975EB
PKLGANEFKGLPRLAKLNDTEKRLVFYHDQLVAVVDLREARKIVRCELVETYEKSEAEQVLRNLSRSHLRIRTISFKEMMLLMDKCDSLDTHFNESAIMSHGSEEKSSRGNTWRIGIVPGTKWCGTGDIAENYHDLGWATNIDRCCRAHDLCPVKIRSFKSRYNLSNLSFYSRSHCACDETFYRCLKKTNDSSAGFIGNIYFNIAQPNCIEEDAAANDNNIKKFVPLKRAF